MPNSSYTTSDFDFKLPESLIANSPSVPRDHSRLLIYNTKKDKIIHTKFHNIIDYFNKYDVLVRNKSKVIPARLTFNINNGRKEVFLLRKINEFTYNVMVKPGKFFTLDKKIICSPNLSLVVKKILKDGTRIIEFITNSNLPKLLNDIGELPLPPYIQDPSLTPGQYQTIYADTKGSVAAPTAGLHFTNSLNNNLLHKGVHIEDTVLHVGRGTFSPVISDDLSTHKMHSEKIIFTTKNAESLNKLHRAQKKITAVGTTSVRILENCFKGGRFVPFNGETDIFIYPGKYKWKVVDQLITNFHLPKSTLIMLVASFLEHKGVKEPVKKILSIYREAIKEKYKFYSLGDAMFII